MQDILSLLTFSGLGLTSAYYTNKFNKKLKKTKRVLAILNRRQWSIEELNSKEDGVIGEFFAERITTSRAASENKDPNKALKERKSKKYKRKMNFIDSIAISKNYETKEYASYRVAVDGRLFNSKPFVVKLKEEDGKHLKKTSMIYLDKETVGNKGKFRSTKIAHLDSFFVTTRFGDNNVGTKSQRRDKLALNGLTSSMLMNLITVYGKIGHSSSAEGIFGALLGGISNFILGRDSTVGVEFGGHVQGVKNGVTVFFISDAILNKKTSLVELINPKVICPSKESFMRIISTNRIKYTVLTLLSISCTLYSAYMIAQNFRRYKRTIKSIFNWFWGAIEKEMNQEGVINVSSLGCRNCPNGKREIVFLPCNHLIMCKDCFRQLGGPVKRCPQCDRAIHNHEQIFIS